MSDTRFHEDHPLDLYTVSTNAGCNRPVDTS